MKPILAALAIGISTLTTMGHAATFTVNGADYDITTLSGSFNEHEAILTQQIWWNDVNLANDFASTVAFDLGRPNSVGGGQLAPYFAHEVFALDVDSQIWDDFFSFTPGLSSILTLLDDDVVWAVTSDTVAVPAVPLPAGGLLLLSGLAFTVGLQRRKTRAT